MILHLCCPQNILLSLTCCNTLSGFSLSLSFYHHHHWYHLQTIHTASCYPRIMRHLSFPPLQSASFSDWHRQAWLYVSPQSQLHYFPYICSQEHIHLTVTADKFKCLSMCKPLQAHGTFFIKVQYLIILAVD